MKRAITWADLEIIKLLGEGQAGTVSLAKLKNDVGNLPAETLVAIKRYKNWVLEEPGQFERIIRELELGRKIKNVNLVETYSIIVDSKRKPTLVMRYYEGETLESYLKNLRNNKKEIDVGFSFEIVGALASALNTLHKAGAIHRDLKPANVILSNSGPVLMDLGVITSKDFPEQTHSYAFLGTIRYAAPEYLFGREYDWRVDVYGLGAIIFELFCRNLFDGKQTHWAHLIVQMAQSRELPLSYDELQSKFGLNVTEFIKFLIDRMLGSLKQRNIDLAAISSIVNERIWERPFYLNSKNEIVHGEPNAISIIINDCKWKQGYVYDKSSALTLGILGEHSLKEIADYIKRFLSNDDLILIKTVLEENYFNLRNYDEMYWLDLVNDSPYSLYDFSSLEEAGAISIECQERILYCNIPSYIILTYRYGLL